MAVGDIADELRERFVAAAKGLRLGDGLDEQTAMGPMAGPAHKERVLKYIEKGIQDGAELVLDGRDAKSGKPAQRLLYRPQHVRSCQA